MILVIIEACPFRFMMPVQGFQTAANAYERGRPEYPATAVERLFEAASIGNGTNVVELGAGTGKFSKLIVSAGACLIAVEPVEGMRNKFASLLPETKIISGRAEEIPLPDACADAVVVAQAFHWFDGPSALGEIHRILKPRGCLGLIWNVRDEEESWVAELTAILDPYEKGAPRYKTGAWKRAFADSDLFDALATSQFPYVQSGPPEMFVDRTASISFIAALPAPEQARVLAQVRDLLRTHPATRGKTAIELPYRTDVYWCRRIERSTRNSAR